MNTKACSGFIIEKMKAVLFLFFFCMLNKPRANSFLDTCKFFHPVGNTEHLLSVCCDFGNDWLPRGDTQRSYVSIYRLSPPFNLFYKAFRNIKPEYMYINTYICHYHSCSSSSSSSYYYGVYFIYSFFPPKDKKHKVFFYLLYVLGWHASGAGVVRLKSCRPLTA